MQCLICFEVPLEPTITPCGHFHCKTCIRQWLETSDSCTNCRSTLSIHDIAEISGFRQAVFEAVHVWCQYKSSGCEMKLSLREYRHHEENCKFQNVVQQDNSNNLNQQEGTNDHQVPVSQTNQVQAKQPRQKKRGPGTKKKSLFDWSDRSWPRKRVKEISDQLDTFCVEKHESKTDVLFFLLRDELEKAGQKNKAKLLDNLRKSKQTYTLTTEQCLSVHADTLLSKGQYRKIYGIFDQNLDLNPVQPPSQLDAEENRHLPGATDFEIIDKNGETVFRHFGKDNIKPTNILSDLQQCSSEVQSPSVKGVRYNYAEAIVSTLYELDPYIEKSLKEDKELPSDQIFHTTIKDGGDGLGSVSVYKEKADQFLPDKALRFSFAVVSSTAKTSDNTTKTVYEAENPNSVRVNRPLLKCIADENNKASSIVCLSPIEMEREYLQDKVIKVKISDGKWRLHKLKFFNSMEDEKYDRAISGYQRSGSKYICVLCDTTQEDSKKHLGSFKINRTYKETKILANILKLNPDNMTASDLAKISKGVKSLPVSYSQPMDKLIYATHTDINLGSFFQKLIVRSIAGVEQWDATQDVIPLLNNAQHIFHMHMKWVTGVNPQLMMPGNYSRVLFDESNTDIILQIIPDEDIKQNLKVVFQKFRFLRKVYRARHPEKEDVANYKSVAVEMGKLLIKHFNYANWPNYLHKIIEHVQEILEDPNGPRSIGAFSGEGNEGGNKLFRLFRKHSNSLAILFEKTRGPGIS